MTIRAGLVAAIGLFLAAAPTLTAPAQELPLVRKQPCTVIASFPYTITAPGNYCLDADHVTDSGGGIAIASNDVSLDCKGHSITKSTRGPWYSVGVGADSNLVNVTIQNCRIKDFGRGLVVGGRNVRMINNWVDGAMREGIAAGGHSAQVIGNRITNTYDDPGNPQASIAVYPYDFGVATSGQVIRDNIVVGAVGHSSYVGIAIYGASTPVVMRNQILDLGPPENVVATSIALNVWGSTATTGAVVTGNSLMSRSPGVQALNAAAVLCSNNVAIGLQEGAFASCQAGTGNISVP